MLKTKLYLLYSHYQCPVTVQACGGEWTEKENRQQNPNSLAPDIEGNWIKMGTGYP